MRDDRARLAGTVGSQPEAPQITGAQPKPVGEFRNGWPTLLAATIGVGLGTTGLGFYSFGQFVRPLAAAFHWGRGEISGGLLCYSIGTIFISPFVGQVVDRVGVRPVALAAQLGLAIGFWLVSLAQPAIWTFYAAWFAISLLGAGTSPIVWSRAVAGLFVRHRGLALGMMLSGTGLAAIVSPMVISRAIADFGWRTAERVLALSLILIGLPVTWFLFRPSPQSSGAQAPVAGTTLASALRGSLFWRLIAAFVLLSMGVAGLIVHLPAMLVDRGLTPIQAASDLGLLGYTVVAGRLGLGLLLDRFEPTLVGAAFVLLTAATSLLLMGHLAPFAAILLLGLCAGAEVDLLAYLFSRYFGLRHFARIYGCGLSAFAFGAGAGPILAGTVHDRTGSYGPALIFFAAASVCAAMLILSLGAGTDLAETERKGVPANQG
jgi:MFS family permease